MRATKTFPAVGLVVLLGTGVTAHGAPPPGDLRPLLADAKTGPARIARFEYDLEMRRAGGPRKAVVQRLLETIVRGGDPEWPTLVADACRRRAADCSDFAPRAEELAKREQAGAPGKASAYQAVLREAELQRLDPTARHEVYRQALTTPGLKQGTVGLTPAEAGIRAIDEGMVDLVPSIDGIEARWRGVSRNELLAHLAIARALTGGTPQHELLILVTQGVDSDVAVQLTPKVHKWPANCMYDSCLTARTAIAELRRLNPADIRMGLKEVLAKYEAVRGRIQRSATQAAGSAVTAPKTEPPSPHAYLGSLGPALAELIGDLGDRETERRALGQETLWDRVNEVERSMAQRGMLKESEAVTLSQP